MSNNQKYASEYALPGGVEQYYDTLVRLLKHIRDEDVLSDDLSQWFFDTFSTTSGQIAVKGYISTLRRMGYWSQQANQTLRLTPEGIELLGADESEPDTAHRMVWNVKYRNFAGYEELIRFLHLGPQDIEALHQHLKSSSKVD